MGLSLSVLVSRGRVVAGLMTAALGVLISTIGIDKSSGAVAERVNGRQTHPRLDLSTIIAGFVFPKRLGVDRNTDDLSLGIGDAGQRQSHLSQRLESWQVMVRQPTHVGTGRLMGEDQSIGRSTVNERHRNAGEGNMPKAPLSVSPQMRGPGPTGM